MHPFQVHTKLLGSPDDTFIEFSLERVISKIDEPLHIHIIHCGRSIRKPGEIYEEDWLEKRNDIIIMALKSFASKLPTNTIITYLSPEHPPKTFSILEFISCDFKFKSQFEVKNPTWFIENYKKSCLQLAQTTGSKIMLCIESSEWINYNFDWSIQSGLKNRQDYGDTLQSLFGEAADLGVNTCLIHCGVEMKTRIASHGVQYMIATSSNSLGLLLDEYSQNLDCLYYLKLEILNDEIVFASSNIPESYIDNEKLIVPTWSRNKILCRVNVKENLRIDMKYSYSYDRMIWFADLSQKYEFDSSDVKSHPLYEAISFHDELIQQTTPVEIIEHDWGTTIKKLLIYNKEEAFKCFENGRIPELSHYLRADKQVVMAMLKTHLKIHGTDSWLPEFGNNLASDPDVVKLAAEIDSNYMWKWELLSIPWEDKKLYFDEKEAIQAIQKDWRNIRWVKDSLLTNNDLVKTLLAINPECFLYLPEKKIEYAMMVLKTNPEAIFYLTNDEIRECLTDLHLCRDLMTKRSFWEYAPLEFKADPTLVLEYLQFHPLQLEDVKEFVNCEIMIKIVARRPELYNNLPEEWKYEPLVANSALVNSRNAYMYESFPEVIQNNRDVLMTAFKMQPKILEFAPFDIRDTKSVAIDLMAHNGKYIYMLSEEMQEDQDVLLTAINQNYQASMYAPHGFMDRLEVYLILNNMYYHLLPTDYGAKKVLDVAILFE